MEQSYSSPFSARLTGQYWPKSASRPANSAGVMHISAMLAALPRTRNIPTHSPNWHTKIICSIPLSKQKVEKKEIWVERHIQREKEWERWVVRDSKRKTNKVSTEFVRCLLQWLLMHYQFTILEHQVSSGTFHIVTRILSTIWSQFIWIKVEKNDEDLLQYVANKSVSGQHSSWQFPSHCSTSTTLNALLEVPPSWRAAFGTTPALPQFLSARHSASLQISEHCREVAILFKEKQQHFNETTAKLCCSKWIKNMHVKYYNLVINLIHSCILIPNWYKK